MRPRDLVILWTEEGEPPELEAAPAPFALYSACRILESVVEIADIAARYLRSPEAQARAHEQVSSEEELRALADRHDVARRRLEEARAALADVMAEAARLLGPMPPTSTTSTPGGGDASEQPG